MSWPYSRLTTYLPNSGSPVKSGDLNAIQDSLISLQSVPLRLMDDFIDLYVDPLNAQDSRYQGTPGGGGSGTTTRIQDDSAHGAFGASLADAGATLASINGTIATGIGTGDFRALFRVSTISASTTGSRALKVGLASTAGANLFGFTMTGAAATGHWQAIVNGGAATTAIVSVTSDVAYQTLEMSRTSGTLNFYVDGTLIYTVADANALTTAVFWCSAVRGGIYTDWWGF